MAALRIKQVNRWEVLTRMPDIQRKNLNIKKINYYYKLKIKIDMSTDSKFDPVWTFPLSYVESKNVIGISEQVKY